MLSPGDKSSPGDSINAMWVEMHLSGDRGDGISHDEPRKP